MQSELFNKISEYTKTVVKESRFEHSERTAKMLADLCKNYGLNEEKGWLAGIAHDMCKDVSDEELFGESHDEPPDALGRLPRFHRTIRQLGFHVLILDDRACNELRKQRNIEQKPEWILLHMNIAAVHVDHIAHRLEREERDADGQRDVRHGKIHERQLV